VPSEVETRLARPLLQRSPMSDERIALGKCGEDLACRELERRGYAIVARRYRRRGGELDIVARDGETTVFVEVKTRQGDRFGAGVESVHGLKRRRMMHLALDYIMRHRLADSPCRFDVVSIQVNEGRTVVEVFQNAFDMCL
jgi:putative endonuclease